MGIMPKKVKTSAKATKAKTTKTSKSSKTKKGASKKVTKEVEQPKVVEETKVVETSSAGSDSQSGGTSSVQSLFSELVEHSDTLLKQQKRMTSNLKKVFKSYNKECKELRKASTKSKKRSKDA